MNRNILILLILGTCILGLSSLAGAQPPGPYGPYYQDRYNAYRAYPPAREAKSPVDLLEDSINKVIDFLSRAPAKDIKAMEAFLFQEIAPHFDFEYMARSVAGRYYNRMTPEQQADFRNAFENLFISTFVQKLSAFSMRPPVVGSFSSRRVGNREATATARVVQDNGRQLKIDFRFLNTPNGWKVVDVKANGVSAVLHYRNYYADQLRASQFRQAPPTANPGPGQ